MADISDRLTMGRREFIGVSGAALAGALLFPRDAISAPPTGLREMLEYTPVKPGQRLAFSDYELGVKALGLTGDYGQDFISYEDDRFFFPRGRGDRDGYWIHAKAYGVKIEDTRRYLYEGHLELMVVDMSKFDPKILKFIGDAPEKMVNDMMIQYDPEEAEKALQAKATGKNVLNLDGMRQVLTYLDGCFTIAMEYGEGRILAAGVKGQGDKNSLVVVDYAQSEQQAAGRLEKFKVDLRKKYSSSDNYFPEFLEPQVRQQGRFLVGTLEVNPTYVKNNNGVPDLIEAVLHFTRLDPR